MRKHPHVGCHARNRDQRTRAKRALANILKNMEPMGIEPITATLPALLATLVHAAPYSYVGLPLDARCLLEARTTRRGARPIRRGVDGYESGCGLAKYEECSSRRAKTHHNIVICGFARRRRPLLRQARPHHSHIYRPRHQPKRSRSIWRDSNPRPPPWQDSALPLSYRRTFCYVGNRSRCSRSLVVETTFGSCCEDASHPFAG